MASIAPRCSFRVVFFGQIFLPDDLAGVGFEANEVAFGAKRVELVGVDNWRAARTGRVRNRVPHRIIIMPFLLSGLLIETLHALSAGEFLAVEIVDFDVRVARVIAKEYALGGHGRSGVSACYRRAPDDMGPALWKLFQEAVFAPDIVAMRPHPLRPAVRIAKCRG